MFKLTAEPLTSEQRSILEQICLEANIPFTTTDLPKPRSIETTVITLSVLPARDQNNNCIGYARVGNETVNSCSAPTHERVLAALGYNTPQAHSHQIYTRRFGGNYKLVLEGSGELPSLVGSGD